LHSITLLPNSQAVGKTLSQLHLENDGVSIQGVRRKGRNADYSKLTLTADLLLQANDILVISGNSEAIDQAEAKLL
jgi:CPA2 family monovalent cation:H+ antiporter-2